MRKVMTGEQVAQLTNRDPFALPVWRAPVYRTPAGIIALVQLVRLLAWLVRLIARHPVAATVAAVLVLAWLNVGWLGLVAPGGLGRGGACRLAVLLAVLVHPVDRRPGAGQVAGLVVLPAPLGRGDGHLRGGALASGPDYPAGARQGVRHPVHRPGGRPAGVRPVPG